MNCYCISQCASCSASSQCLKQLFSEAITTRNSSITQRVFQHSVNVETNSHRKVAQSRQRATRNTLHPSATTAFSPLSFYNLLPKLAGRAQINNNNPRSPRPRRYHYAYTSIVSHSPLVRPDGQTVHPQTRQRRSHGLSARDRPSPATCTSPYFTSHRTR